MPTVGRTAGFEEGASAGASTSPRRSAVELLGERTWSGRTGPDQRYYVVDHRPLGAFTATKGVDATVIADLTMVERDTFWA